MASQTASKPTLAPVSAFAAKSVKRPAGVDPRAFDRAVRLHARNEESNRREAWRSFRDELQANLDLLPSLEKLRAGVDVSAYAKKHGAVVPPRTGAWARKAGPAHNPWFWPPNLYPAGSGRWNAIGGAYEMEVYEPNGVEMVDGYSLGTGSTGKYLYTRGLACGAVIEHGLANSALSPSDQFATVGFDAVMHGRVHATGAFFGYARAVVTLRVSVTVLNAADITLAAYRTASRDYIDVRAWVGTYGQDIYADVVNGPSVTVPVRAGDVVIAGAYLQQSVGSGWGANARNEFAMQVAPLRIDFHA